MGSLFLIPCLPGPIHHYNYYVVPPFSKLKRALNCLKIHKSGPLRHVGFYNRCRLSGYMTEALKIGIPTVYVLHNFYIVNTGMDVFFLGIPVFRTAFLRYARIPFFTFEWYTAGNPARNGIPFETLPGMDPFFVIS